MGPRSGGGREGPRTGLGPRCPPPFHIERVRICAVYWKKCIALLILDSTSLKTFTPCLPETEEISISAPCDHLQLNNLLQGGGTEEQKFRLGERCNTAFSNSGHEQNHKSSKRDEF